MFGPPLPRDEATLGADSDAVSRVPGRVRLEEWRSRLLAQRGELFVLDACEVDVVILGGCRITAIADIDFVATVVPAVVVVIGRMTGVHVGNRYTEHMCSATVQHLGGAISPMCGRLARSNDQHDIVGEIESQIRAGYLGVSVHPEYAPGVSQLELMELGRTVERLQVPMCVHARFSDNISPGLQSEATGELVQVARETGAHVHIEHLNSTGGTGRMAEALGEIEDALAEGLSMSACMYPYEFWATTLKSNRFQDWQEKFGLSYDQLQVAGQPERLTAETFAQAYDENLLTAAFAIPPGDIDLGLQASFMIIGSDAILERPHNNHPRSTGCFARTLGVYTRDRNIIDLPQALAMMTIRPAKLLERGSPAMRTKGRMQIGADADVTVFNPDTIIDRSTIENPAQESVGVDYVFVNGTAIRRAGINQLDIGRPGSAIRSSII